MINFNTAVSKGVDREKHIGEGEQMVHVLVTWRVRNYYVL